MLKTLLDVPIKKDIRSQSLMATGMTMGLVSTGVEYGIAWGYEKVLKEPYYVYHPEDGMHGVRHTSPWSPIVYGTMSIIGIELARTYFISKGYTNMDQVKPDEWLGMFLAFGGGMLMAELTAAPVIRAVTGKEYYKYPTSGLKYTHTINGAVWGIAGVLGLIASMKIINRFEKAPDILFMGSGILKDAIKDGLVK